MSYKSRVAIIDEHPALLRGAAEALEAESSLRVVATANTVDEFVHSGAECDVVLLSLSLGDHSTPAQNIRRLRPVGRVVAYCAPGYRELATEAKRAGAVGVVCKSAQLNVLSAAVIGARHAPVTHDDAYEHPVPRQQPPFLTERETEVLAGYAAGLTAGGVAEKLFISPDTVHDHIKRIRVKYQAAGRPAPTKVDLFRRAQEDGII